MTAKMHFILWLVFVIPILSCMNIRVPVTTEVPESIGDKDSLDQINGQTRQFVKEKLGFPQEELTIDDKDYMIYVTSASHTTVDLTFAMFLPAYTGKTHSNILVCLRIELDEEGKVNNYKTKYLARRYGEASLDTCRKNFWFWSREKLVRYAHFDRYQELVETDPNNAFQWLCKSADQGYQIARYELGNLLAFGRTGFSKRSYTRAYVWYSLSGYFDDQITRQSFVDRHLSEMEHDEAELMLREWQPGQCESDLGLKLEAQ